MLAGFLGRLGEDTATSWLKLISAPVIVFWGLGALAWWVRNPSDDVVSRLGDLSGTEQIVLAAVAAGVLVGSSAVLAEFSQPLLRLLEGYWPGVLDGFRNQRIAKQIERHRRDRTEWEELTRAHPGSFTAPQSQVPPHDVAVHALAGRRETHLDLKLHETPVDESMTMPTRLGNVLRAAETYPDENYGLNGAIMWPRLWLLLPDTTRAVLVSARRDVDQSVTVMVALIASLVWTPLTWWVLMPALVGPPVVYNLFVVRRSRVMAELVRATFDLHRGLLYTSLRFESPSDPATEVNCGRELTRYIWRGFGPVGMEFKDPDCSSP